MLTGKSINVGQIIHREICAYAVRNSGALFFPSLITRMCCNARAPYLVNEEKLHNTGEIDAIAVARIAQEGPAEPSHRPSSSRPSAASNSSTPSETLQQLKSLEQRISQQEVQQYQMMTLLQQIHQQQQQFWAYAKERDNASKKSLQKNFTKPIPSFPAFLEEILQDLDDEHMAESDEDGSNGAAA
ncbi:hypothetical protein PanWU01x14_283290 [Parasponia andersonii]|uniref:Uncharacterized protein n=1 Tax=Parasponia andersonii TaxID=3476 RepID=A0A2P5B0E3_PARAD|nr:hypothetical protein PanWU01x14_283290 [Parasponia andersonii]